MLWSEKQKRQGVRLAVNWWAGRKCWRKYISGKTLYFQHPNSAEGYARAAAEYYAYLDSQEPKKPHQEEYETGLAVLRRMLGWYDRFGTPGDEEKLEGQITELKTVLEKELEADEPCPLERVLPNGTRKYHFPLADELRGDVPNLTTGQPLRVCE